MFEKQSRRCGNVLKLVGHHIDGGSKRSQRFLIVVRGEGGLGGNVAGGVIGLGAEDVCAVAHLRSRKGQHTTQLTTTENPD